MPCQVRHAVTGHRTAVASLLGMHELPAARVDEVLGFDRTVFIPSLAVSLAELTAAVQRVVAPESHGALGRVTYQEDATLSAAVASFPTKVISPISPLYLRGGRLLPHQGAARPRASLPVGAPRSTRLPGACSLRGHERASRCHSRHAVALACAGRLRAG